MSWWMKLLTEDGLRNHHHVVRSTSAHCWSWELEPRAKYMQKGLKVNAVTLVIALAKPLLQYRISSCDSAKPHPVSQKDVQVRAFKGVKPELTKECGMLKRQLKQIRVIQQRRKTYGPVLARMKNMISQHDGAEMTVVSPAGNSPGFHITMTSRKRDASGKIPGAKISVSCIPAKSGSSEKYIFRQIKEWIVTIFYKNPNPLSSTCQTNQRKEPF
ncbi:hypothetical protein HGM15179_003475 [Zosterops borbonicus]|uniref:Uncharacterized protein n=1 Tax=Zosterops borbonicus TaxID=364589 RepID=A0A8K1GR26_9PASS|nr:hypothetical protein HGM15179_003475 [Zosterops borbonicus]